MSSTTVECQCGAQVQFTEADRKKGDIRCGQCGARVVYGYPQNLERDKGAPGSMLLD